MSNVKLELLVPFLIYEFVTSRHPTTKNYSDRKMWQKVGYLAQQLGLPLGDYKFGWYKAGPYSTAYTSLLYDIKNNYFQIEEELNNNTLALNYNTQYKLSSIKRLVSQKPFELDLSDWLELLASILYLKKNNSLDQEATLKKLIRLKPHFNDKVNNSYAWDLLERENLL
ncbi:hypothetical protein HMPREF1013_01820 [Bacillus sp. 2_A_57_CT2]|nr:hypothetical protein HMPREF1013_01820 [Bacillus sp. 2_A_57_CT2]